VYTSEDLHTRAAIAYENYVITITVEARCLCDLVTMHLLPVAKSAPSGSTELCVLLEAAVAKMQAAMAAVDDMETDTVEAANACTEVRLGNMVEIRKLAEELQKLLPARSLSLATYKELLFDDMAHCVPRSTAH